MTPKYLLRVVKTSDSLSQIHLTYIFVNPTSKYWMSCMWKTGTIQGEQDMDSCLVIWRWALGGFIRFSHSCHCFSSLNNFHGLSVCPQLSGCQPISGRHLVWAWRLEIGLHFCSPSSQEDLCACCNFTFFLLEVIGYLKPVAGRVSSKMAGSQKGQ